MLRIVGYIILWTKVYGCEWYYTDYTIKSVDMDSVLYDTTYKNMSLSGNNNIVIYQSQWVWILSDIALTIEVHGHEWCFP